MNKSYLKLMDKVLYKGDEVTVIDISRTDNKVGIARWGNSLIVDAGDLSPKAVEPAPPTPHTTEDVAEVEVYAGNHGKIKGVEFEYDEATRSIFIILNNKATICLTHLKPEIMNCIGIAIKHKNDAYCKKIGHAIAFKDAIEKEREADEDDDDLTDMPEELKKLLGLE